MFQYENIAQTITIGEVAENHTRMQKIGQLGDHGIMISEFEAYIAHFEGLGFQTEVIDLKALSGITDEAVLSKMEDAKVLLVRRGVDAILSNIGANRYDMFMEQRGLSPDKKAFMYGKVLNKNARHNLCFADFDQEPDYENKKGTVVSFGRVPLTRYVKEYIEGLTNRTLLCEGNYYYDIRKTGIGFHGDTERRIVIGVKLGEIIPLHYQWFHNGNAIGNRIELASGDGDIYFMSDKATGYDWKKKKLYTLRHAVGCKRFITIKPKKVKAVANNVVVEEKAEEESEGEGSV